MIKDIGINAWGHQSQIKRDIEDMQNGTLILNESNEATLEEGIEPEPTLEEEVTSQEKNIVGDDEPTRKACKLCESSTQHCCTLCGKKVCTIYCSVVDLNSSN